MSQGLSADRLWMDDLEDILGLAPGRGGTDEKLHQKRSLASFKPIYAVVLAVGLVGVAAELNRSESSTGVVRRSIEPAGAIDGDRPRGLPSPAAGSSVFANPGVSPYATRDLAYGVAAPRDDLGRAAGVPMTAGEKSVAAVRSRPVTAQAVASGTMRSGGKRSPPNSTGTARAAASQTGKLPPLAGYSPDELPRLARTAPSVRPAEGAQANGDRLADGLPPPALASLPRSASPATPASSRDQSNGETSPQEAGVAGRSDVSRRKSARELEAIDALRMLRRQ